LRNIAFPIIVGLSYQKRGWEANRGNMNNVIKICSMRSLCLWCLAALIGCSSIPGFRPNAPEGDKGDKAGQKLYLNISPAEALDILTEIAPERGWEVKSVGEQYDLTGPRGKYFRLETQRLIGGKAEMSGVFFGDPKGTYVLIGEREMGLPEDLVDPLKAAVQQRVGGASDS
jgi:hypothetical protein